jgi:uracil-DNA glycosylase family 4
MDTSKLDRIQRLWSDCQKCDLCKTRKQVVFWRGHPQARLAIIGEAPGEMEDRRGKPFLGQAGELFEELCEKAVPNGVSPEPWSVFICNTIGCRPPKNRKPTIKEFMACESRLYAMIAAVNPRMLLLLGGTALEMLTGQSKIMEAAGKTIEVEFEWKRRPRIYKAIPTLHPGFILRNRNNERIASAVVSHIRAAWELSQDGSWVEGD